MLLYKNNRFCYEGISFSIPDGYYLDTNYGDGAEDSLDFWSKDKRLRIRIAIEKATKGPLEELEFVIRELEECTVLAGPEANILNGLAGYRATYDTGRRQYCEMRYVVPCTCQTELMLLFVGDLKLPSSEVLNNLLEMIAPKIE